MKLPARRHEATGWRRMPGKERFQDKEEMDKGYYSNPQVVRRVLEFLGGSGLKDVTCQYLATGDATHAFQRRPLPMEALALLFGRDADIYRSLLDRNSLIADLDIEYVNFDHPGEAFLDPQRVFELQAPVEQTANLLFSYFNLDPLRFLSGRGHHFVWRVSLDSPVFVRLAALGRATMCPQNDAVTPESADAGPVSGEVASAFHGLGLVMEYLAHLLKQIAAPLSGVPVELTAVEVGPGRRGREMISIDISEYGDPLCCRTLRVPFSRYLKPQYQQTQIGEDALKLIPPLFCVPLHDMDWRGGVAVMRDQRLASELAECAPAAIPEQSIGMDALLREYETSQLSEFHRGFYSEEHDAPGRWPETYDRLPAGALPACARVVLDHPNDLLLQPARIRLLTRTLLALGWHPRHIAGLVRSKFERDHAWGPQWTDADPAMRADFYVRVFYGLFAVGADDLVDFNCKSCQESGLCPVLECTSNLEWFQRSALDRRNYDRMAHRPFNRLFLPQEHL